MWTKDGIVRFIDAKEAGGAITPEDAGVLRRRVERKFKSKPDIIEGDLFDGFPALLPDMTKNWPKYRDGAPAQIPS